MDLKEVVNGLIKHSLRSRIVRCQNAIRFYIHVHQQNVEKLQQAENAEAKTSIIVAEQKMLEVQEEQNKVLKEIYSILENYSKEIKRQGKKCDIENLYGAANRLISFELEKAVSQARLRGGGDTNGGNVKRSGGSANSNSAKRKRSNTNASVIKPKLSRPPIPLPIDQISSMKDLKDITSVIKSLRDQPTPLAKQTSVNIAKQMPKVKSNHIKNSRMNLLEALKKAKETSETQQEMEIKLEDDASSSDDSIIMIDSNGHNSEVEENTNMIPVQEINDDTDDDENAKLPASIKKDFEFVGTIEIPDETVEIIENKIHQKRKSPASDTSSQKSSSRRSSDFEDLIVGQPDESLEDLGQERFLKYFGLFTAEQIDQLKTRRVSRRRRNCTSNVRKDFHYGQFDVNYVPVKNNKPVLFSPVEKVRAKRKQTPLIPAQTSVAPPASQPSSQEPLSIVGPVSKIIYVPPQQQTKSILRVSNIVEAAISKDMKTCVACNQMSDVETMNACLLCYNFYHLQCHTMDRELRERENLCPDCLRQGLEKKKRRMELKKRLNFQVLQANHKASIMQQRQKLQT
uniref:CSON001377 protein n=1 Tax=Culicoides sonorensis TaxID=179676 RepID=A0A336MMG5_CULSO